MKKILFSLLTVAAVSANAQNVIFFDDFESYDDFTITDFGGWKQYDLDKGKTWAITNMTFPNQGYVGAGIVFNSSKGTGTSSLAPYSGKKGLYYLASGASGTTYPNDDWTVSPLISLAGASKSKLELYAKGDQSYGPDQFNIGVSTTGKVEDFVFINSSPIIANKTSYKKYEFDLSEFDGKDIYIAINCTTDDGLILMIDDFKVTAETLSTSDINAKNVTKVYPNPVVDAFKIDLGTSIDKSKVTVELFDMVGKKIQSFDYADQYDISSLPKGVYVLKINDGTTKVVKKIVKK